MSTSLIYLEDPYRTDTVARVLDMRGDILVVDRTVYYPGIGVSSPDCGSLLLDDGTRLGVLGGVWLEHGRLGHRVDINAGRLAIGDEVTVKVDSMQRYLRMRTHTALHIIALAFPFAIVGGQVGPGRGHIDFKVDHTAMSTTLLQHQVHRLATQDLPVDVGWREPTKLASDERVEQFTWPQARDAIRVVGLGNFEVQACDGLHVRNTSEIGNVTINGIVPMGNDQVRVKMSLTEMESFPFLAHASPHPST
ncbi:MAG: alanyl-tRNA editing protein [Rhizobiaceae bacterium]|nr:alanyl-tRNA editing protein [Rhizobiaceae bacterium]